MNSISEFSEVGPLVANDWGPSTRISLWEVNDPCRGGLVGSKNRGELVWVLAHCVKTGTRPLAGPRLPVGFALF